MANSLTDIFAALQNGVVALSNFSRQMTGSFNNISAQLTALQANPYKVITFNRVLTVASGNVSYTGVGFQPRLVQFLVGVLGGNPSFSVGVTDAGQGLCVEDSGTSAFFQNIPGIQRDTAAGGSYQTFSLASFDPDGFTLAWVKVGTPTVTASIVATCFR